MDESFHPFFNGLGMCPSPLAVYGISLAEKNEMKARISSQFLVTLVQFCKPLVGLDFRPRRKMNLSQVVPGRMNICFLGIIPPQGGLHPGYVSGDTPLEGISQQGDLKGFLCQRASKEPLPKEREQGGFVWLLWKRGSGTMEDRNVLPFLLRIASVMGSNSWRWPFALKGFTIVTGGPVGWKFSVPAIQDLVYQKGRVVP